MSRGEILLPLACLLLFGGGSLFFSHETPAPQILARIDVQRIAKPHSVPVPQTPQLTEIIAPQKVEASLTGPTSPGPTIPDIPLDAAETLPSSWETPFSADLWHSTGWKFSKDSMTSTPAGLASATFRRPYHKLMLECDLLATETSGSKWELQLATRNGQVVMRLVLRDGRLAVVTTENGLTHVTTEKPLTVPLSRTTPRHFRVVATGNRIVISWDRKRFLTTEQLAAQSGREIVWSIHTTGTEYQVSNLRIEGD